MIGLSEAFLWTPSCDRLGRQVPILPAGTGGVSRWELPAALDTGEAGVHCGTAFLATPESLAHPHHKTRVVAATGSDAVPTDAFVLDRPAGSAVRVIASSMTDALGSRQMGRDREALRCEAIAWDGDLPRVRCGGREGGGA